MENKFSMFKQYTACEELIASMVKNLKVDGMITRMFIDKYSQICKDKDVQNVIADNEISKIVKKHGYIVVDKKIAGHKWRVFKLKS